MDLAAGWVQHPRPKNGIARRCPLWPESIHALREVLAKRKAPADDRHGRLVFLTIHGMPWANGTYGTRITHKTDALLRQLKIKRPGLSFYTLRHTHRTIADGSRDQRACDYIMGHADPTMAGHYVERIDDARLKAVSNHVQAWLFPPEETQGKMG